MRDDPPKPPRFPYVAALLCVACLGAAAWTWMRYSYCWDVTLLDTMGEHPRSVAGPLDGRYALIRGRVRRVVSGVPRTTRGPDSLYPVKTVAHLPWILDLDSLHGTISVRVRAPYKRRFERGSELVLLGRLRQTGGSLSLDKTASRFHGASVAGLVVGAMGVFVFTVALRHWLGERRKFREEARGHNTSVERAPSAS